MSISAVIVTRNRLEYLKKFISTLRKQSRKFDEIIVINNNSSDGTYEWLNEQKDITIINQENLGSSGGQYSGIKYSFEKGHEWIFCADDDISLEDDKFVEKFYVYKKNFPKNTMGISCLQKYDDGNTFLMSQKFSRLSKKIVNMNYKKTDFLVSTDIISFAGVFFNREVVTLAGLPLKGLFISYDDAEYSARIIKKGGLLFSCPSLVVNHHLVFNKGVTYGFWGNRLYDSNSDWRMFYEKRNYYVTLLTFEKSLGVFIRIAYLFIRSIIFITISGEKKKHRYKIQLRALKEAVTNQLTILK